MITKVLSEKIKIASFICTVMVVFRHSRNLQAFDISADSYCAFIETVFSKITEIAVPYFFLVSGFFFFSQSYCKFCAYKTMFSKKLRTLFIPFLFWNIVGFIIFAFAGQIGFNDYWYVYIINILTSTWNGPLWYVRDLMTMIFFIPVYGWIMNWGKWWLFTIVFIVLFHLWIPVACNWVSYESILFFFGGGILWRYPIVINYKTNRWVLGILFVIWMMRCIIFPNSWFLNKYNIILGIIVFWQLLNYLPKKIHNKCLKIAPFSFFIYVAHIFVVKIAKAGANHFFHGNDFVALITYFACPIITIALLFHLGKKWKKHFLSSYNLVTGNR